MRAGPEGKTQDIEFAAVHDSNQFTVDMLHTTGTDGQANPTPTAKHFVQSLADTSGGR